MTKHKVRRLEANTLMVTADCSKGKHMGYFRAPSGVDVKPFEFENSRPGFEFFFEKVLAFARTHQLSTILFGFESTGSYSACLANFMASKGVRLTQVNPKHTKRVKELSGNSPNKTDRKDPKVIADIIALGHGLTVLHPRGAVAELRYLAHAREGVLTDITRVKNRMEALISLFFPEFLVIMKGLTTKTSMYLLTHYPTPGQLGALGPVQLTKLLKQVSRGKLGKPRAAALHAAAQSSIGLVEGLPGMVATLRCYLKQLDLLEDQKSTLETRLDQTLVHLPGHELILSIKGLGTITAAVLLSEVVDFKGYARESEVLKLSGLDLYEVSSGKHKGDKRISKRGRSLLRKALFYAALNTVKAGRPFYQDYQGHLAKGTKKIKALTIISKKILRVIFSMIKHNQYYDEKYTTLRQAA